MAKNTFVAEVPFNVKSSTYYFHMKTKILADFQVCINVSLNVYSLTVLPIAVFRLQPKGCGEVFL